LSSERLTYFENCGSNLLTITANVFKQGVVTVAVLYSLLTASLLYGAVGCLLHPLHCFFGAIGKVLIFMSGTPS
jgi:hypothetical protein